MQAFSKIGIIRNYAIRKARLERSDCILYFCFQTVYCEKMGDFKCSQCGDTFDSADELAYHIKDDHSSGGEDKFECSVCGEEFESKEQLKEHMGSAHSG